MAFGFPGVTITADHHSGIPAPFAKGIDGTITKVPARQRGAYVSFISPFFSIALVVIAPGRGSIHPPLLYL
jgi:hypothetical protein